MKCGFLSKKFYFLKENVRTYLIGFSVLHFAKEENWILCKSAELVKLGISIYFWLGNSSKKSRLAFFSSFKILLDTSLEPLEKSFSSNFAFCTVECSRARRILRRSNYLKRAVFHLRFSFSKLSASFHESFTKAVHIA